MSAVFPGAWPVDQAVPTVGFQAGQVGVFVTDSRLGVRTLYRVDEVGRIAAACSLHRAVAGLAYGRELGEDDRVWCLDGDKRNVSPENLVVMNPALLSRWVYVLRQGGRLVHAPSSDFRWHNVALNLSFVLEHVGLADRGRLLGALPAYVLAALSEVDDEGGSPW